MISNRVVITGIGVLAANGIGKEAFWRALVRGESGISRITLFDASRYRSQIAGEVKDFALSDFIEPRSRQKHFARQSRLTLAGAVLAVRDAGLESGMAVPRGPVPVILGISSSAIEVIEEGIGQLDKRGPSRVPTYIVSACQPHQAASLITAEFGFATDGHTVGSACASGMEAVAMAYDEIRSGRADLAITGGGDAPITPLAFACFDRAGLASTRNDEPEKASRPFDRDADSGVIAEGAAVLVIENLDHALARGARIYLEITGYGTYANPDEALPLSGMGRAMELAMANAACAPEAIDFICAHGPGHPLLDRAETRVIHEVFGHDAHRPAVSSIKGVLGNPLAAAGPLQLAACACMAEYGRISPIANLENPAVDCDLDYVRDEARYVPPACKMLVNVHGLGGCNSSMVVEMPSDL
jgi:3-oxoacyl-[acyl-carrier-protein] synthase II